VRRVRSAPWALTALVALVYVVATPPTTDLAAQVHRVDLARDGVWLVDLSWFGGHHLPSYSVLMPLAGLLVAPQVLAAIASVPAAWAFGRLAERHRPGPAAVVASWWFAAGIGALLFTGRVTFVLGAAVGLLTLLVAAGPRAPARPLAVALGGVATALASPVAALFLALAGVAWALGGRARAMPTVVAVTAMGSAVALAVAFPGGGSEPFVASALVPAVVALAVALVVLPRTERTLLAGVALYLVAIVLAGTLDTPMGGNATRLAALAGGPVLALALWGRRPVALALLALPFAYWQAYPPVRDATQAWSDDATHAAVWAPLRDELARRLARDPGRVEVPPTARRGEVRWLGVDVPLARGWIRQLDRERHALFYDGHGADDALTAAAYRAWLDDNAVSLVAVPDDGVAVDYASRREVELLRSGTVPGLREVWRGGRWRLLEVRDARPLAAPVKDGASVVVRALTAGHVTLEAPAGVVDLRVRHSRWLRVLEGAACVERGPGGWTRVRTTVAGTVTIGGGIRARRSGAHDACSP